MRNAVFWQSMPHPPIAGERAFIRSLRTQVARLAGSSPVRSHGLRPRTGARAAGVALGIGDDCAILRRRQVMKSLSLQTFRSKRSIFAAIGTLQNLVGHRCLARGLSVSCRRRAPIRWPRFYLWRFPPNWYEAALTKPPGESVSSMGSLLWQKFTTCLWLGEIQHSLR